MKIIELLNKIANGNIPKKVKYCNDIYEYNKEEQDYGYFETGLDRYINLIEDKIICTFNLLEEVEILEEEKKIPEKLNYFDLTKDNNEKDENGDDLELHYTGVADTFDDVYEKINEIIDYLKSKGDK